MSKYVVFGNYEGIVSYGINDATFLFGIYDTEKQAHDAMEIFKNKEEPFVDSEGTVIVDNDNVGFNLMDYKLYKPDSDGALIKYSDFGYCVAVFNDSPVYIIDSRYIE